MEFKCSGCDYTSCLKSHVVRHINRKNKCGVNLKVVEINIAIICEICGKKYKTKGNLKKHLKNCKIDDEKDQIIKKLEDKVEELNNKLSSNSGTIITNNITNIQQNIIINVTPYNDPDLDGLEKYYLMALKKLFMSVPTIIEKVHFNTEYPQNHNICISNYRNKLAKVFNGKEWRTMNEDKLIQELLDTYESLLENWAEDDEDRMKYIEKYNDIKNNDNKKIDEIKEEIKNMIYDKRSMIKIKN